MLDYSDLSGGVLINITDQTSTDAQGSVDYFSGFESIRGGLGNDTLLGGSGNDLLLGGAGNDSIDGSAGADTLWGEAGNDT